MKKLIFITICFFWIFPSLALAQLRPFETMEESRQRHSDENFQTYEDHHRQAPMGGYPERFGDPAPPGTDRPGFMPPPSSFQSPGPTQPHQRRLGP